MPITSDRGEIIRFAGLHRLSPAFSGGAPALVGPGESGGRCGWADFFAALRRADLVASFDPADAASLRLVPRGGASASGAGPSGAPGALAQARRFLAALRGRYPSA